MEDDRSSPRGSVEQLGVVELQQTMTAVAHPWLCDVMGHLNTRHVVAIFDDAAFALIDALGYPLASDLSRNRGWADVRLEMDLKHEVPVGTVLRVRSGVTRLGSKSFSHVHHLVSGGSDTLHAILHVTTVRFDLESRRAIELPNAFRSRAKEYAVAAGLDQAQQGESCVVAPS